MKVVGGDHPSHHVMRIGRSGSPRCFKKSRDKPTSLYHSNHVLNAMILIF